MYWYLKKHTPSKARKDVGRIAEDMGFHNLGWTREPASGKVSDFFLTMSAMLRLPFVIRKGDYVLLPYNLRKYYLYICRMTHWRGGKVITLIHDLSNFYRKHISAAKEISRLNHSDYLIAHNPVMKQWLIDNGIKRPVGVLEIFDYLSDKDPQEKEMPRLPYRVLYAGTLSPDKNSFLYDLQEHIHSYRLSLYGRGFDDSRIRNKKHFDYKGFVSSDDLVATADGDFGLVWDGNSLDVLSGPRGNYMRYNNPHKFSLYLRCGLPVVVWNDAAIAPFVKEKNVGICIQSLKDLDSALAAISPEQYAEMRQNVALISRNLSEGFYLKKAFAEAVEALQTSGRMNSPD